MRDDFTEKTKNILAMRVAYRCSFPACTRITVGAGTKSNDHVISIGEAAHIFSAAPSGPRNNPNLTSEQRSSVENGIWMCKIHARLIDVDESNYSAETLLKWKLDAENFVRERLETLEKEDLSIPLTLIMLDIKLVLECKWIYVKEETWRFRIYNYVEGSVTDLREYITKFSNLPEWDKYVVVESQGDGRMLTTISLISDDDGYILSCELQPKSPRSSPHDVGGDLAMDDDGDLVLADGDLGNVHGINNALQIIRSNLSAQFGWWANPHFGSHFDSIYKNYSNSELLLNSMVKLELVRLLTVPTPNGLFETSLSKPELNFVNRINWVKVNQYDSSKLYLPIIVSLEWGNNENWQGELKIPFSLNENVADVL